MLLAVEGVHFGERPVFRVPPLAVRQQMLQRDECLLVVWRLEWPEAMEVTHFLVRRYHLLSTPRLLLGLPAVLPHLLELGHCVAQAEVRVLLSRLWRRR